MAKLKLSRVRMSERKKARKGDPVNDTEDDAVNEKEEKGLCKATFLYMEPRKEDNPKTFAFCAGCRMFMAKQGLCSLHGPDVKVDGDDSCGLFVRGKAVESELAHVEASVTKEESGFIEGYAQCHQCEYYEKADGDCLLFRLLNIEDYKVHKNGCCNAFSSKAEDLKDKDNGKEEIHGDKPEA